MYNPDALANFAIYTLTISAVLCFVGALIIILKDKK